MSKFVRIRPDLSKWLHTDAYNLRGRIGEVLPGASSNPSIPVKVGFVDDAGNSDGIESFYRSEFETLTFEHLAEQAVKRVLETVWMRKLTVTAFPFTPACPGVFTVTLKEEKNDGVWQLWVLDEQHALDYPDPFFVPRTYKQLVLMVQVIGAAMWGVRFPKGIAGRFLRYLGDLAEAYDLIEDFAFK